MTIKIYTTNHCPYCKQAKEFFTKNNVKFTEFNVEEDQAAAEEMIDKSGQMGVPVIDMNGTVIIGFNKPAIEKELKKAK
jgi:glutaredoxin-like YruB-family protein